MGPNGFDATGLPFIVDRDAGPTGRLRGHVARANTQWRDIDGLSALVLFPLTDGYVSPSSYPSKAEHGKVVPTWNYEVVHVLGTVHIHDDPEWLRSVVTDLTDQHEANRSVESPWAVTDAPDDYIDKQLRAIVGIEVQVESIEGKRKLSQNRSEADRLGAAAALASSPRRRDQAVAAAMDRLSDAAS
jgi:transcriptional regulator